MFISFPFHGWTMLNPRFFEVKTRRNSSSRSVKVNSTTWLTVTHHDTSWYIMIHHDTPWYIIGSCTIGCTIGSAQASPRSKSLPVGIRQCASPPTWSIRWPVAVAGPPWRQTARPGCWRHRWLIAQRGKLLVFSVFCWDFHLGFRGSFEKSCKKKGFILWIYILLEPLGKDWTTSNWFRFSTFG